MCGIAAIIGKNKSIEDKLKTSLFKIVHRGNHDLEYLILGDVALGANRLGIIDDEKGIQPQQNEDGTVLVVHNGEIFNYKELQKELSSQGHVFRTNNDTEVLVHLWEEYQEEMVNKIDSEMFAFIIFDKKIGKIFVARDPIGVKPLYYGIDSNSTFYFASEIKALVCHKEISQIYEFPPGHYFYNNKFIKYLKQESKEDSQDNIQSIQNALEAAVLKRVQTNLPIAVFLSGGVDSSLAMELATKYHPNVTGLILGESNSPDYIEAVKLCEEKKWKYKTLLPKIDYEKELSQLIYFLETYEPNIVRHSFANNIISKFAHDLGFKIVLTGEGIDEIFAGYNEFLEIDKSKINHGCQLLLDSMSKGNLMRVDKMAMRYTVETRCPFFDQQLVDIAMNLDGSEKIGEYKGKQYTKLILRKAALKYLPEKVAFREKLPFANGAGMNIGNNYKKADGIFGKIAEHEISNDKFEKMKSDFSEYSFETKEEILFFEEYLKFGFNKFVEGKERLIVKDTLYSI